MCSLDAAHPEEYSEEVGLLSSMAGCQVFTQRFISVCLLFLYGIPACIGPGWHRHDSACQHGQLAEIACCSGSEHGNSTAETGAHCHKHAEHSPEHGVKLGCDQGLAADPTQQSSNPRQSERSSLPHHGVCTAFDAHDDCLVCAFYAQAQFAALGSTTIAASMAIGYVSQSAIDSEVERLSTLTARGPPAVLA